jgi:hypothetical protein
MRAIENDRLFGHRDRSGRVCGWSRSGSRLGVMLDRGGGRGVQRRSASGGDGDVILSAERADDFGRDFDVALNSAAGEQRRIYAGEDFVERQLDERAVAVVLGRKSSRRRGLAEFTKGNANGALGKLREHLLHGHEHFGFADIHVADAGHEFGGKAAENGAQRQGESGTDRGLLGDHLLAGAFRAGQTRLVVHAAGGGGESGSRGLGGSLDADFAEVLSGAFGTPAEQFLERIKHVTWMYS